MKSRGETSISKSQRRAAMRLAYLNGACWSLGNGLVSTSLVVYLVRTLGAEGLGISLIVAAPPLVGALRQFAPVLIGRLTDRKSFCLLCFGISAILLASLTQLSEPGRMKSPAAALSAVVVLWTLYHLFEYAATVALWSWLGDIAPRRIRGRFVGRRERWMMLTRVIAMLASGGFSYYWVTNTVPEFHWIAYTIPALAGAAIMMLAIIPLLHMPAAAPSNQLPPLPVWKDLFGPLLDPRMRWLIVFGMIFSFANGITQSAQFYFPMEFLGLTLLARLLLEGDMRLNQSIAAPHVGKLIDRIGSRPVMIVSQVLVAAGLLFFLTPSPSWWWLIIGAWTLWTAYVGLNVGLPSLMLKLAGPQQSAAYVASFYAFAGVVYGISTILGGLIVDLLRFGFTPHGQTYGLPVEWTPSVLLQWHLLFIAGWLLRTLAVTPLLFLKEPRN